MAIAQILSSSDWGTVMQKLKEVSELTEHELVINSESNPSLELKVSMGDNWDVITESAMEFSEKHVKNRISEN